MENKDTAIIITTRDRKELVRDCIQSILDSEYKSVDIYVVDNGGKDGTYTELTNTFGDKIICMRTDVNRGSGSGTNIGYQEAIKKEYKYYAICDDDIIVDSKMIGRLVDFLEKHPKVGAVGPKIYQMKNRNALQSWNNYLGWDGAFNLSTDGCGKSGEDLEEYIYVDYIPACFLFVRGELARKITTIETEYYAYFDDVDFTQKVIIMGYKLAIYRDAYMWHGLLSMTGKQKETTYTEYYWNRSRLSFYIKYTPKDKLESMIRVFMERMYSVCYEKIYRKRELEKNIIIEAYMDALSGITGERDEMVVEYEKEKDVLKNTFSNKKVYVQQMYNESILVGLLNETNAQIYVNLTEKEFIELKEHLLEFDNINKEIHRIEMKESEVEYDVKLKYIFHVRDIEDYDEEYMYVDRFGNYVRTNQDALYWKDFYNNRDVFIKMFKDVFVSKAKALRERQVLFCNREST